MLDILRQRFPQNAFRSTQHRTPVKAGFGNLLALARATVGIDR
ncbi:MAG: hypothetical protein QOJ51_2578 [Acidobacteriaceae bacterium]|nr:hypothetical protein [Acidobacteriaceae bacterium]